MGEGGGGVGMGWEEMLKNQPQKPGENQGKWEEKGQIGKKMRSLPGASPAGGMGWLRP